MVLFLFGLIQHGEPHTLLMALESPKVGTWPSGDVNAEEQSPGRLPPSPPAERFEPRRAAWGPDTLALVQAVSLASRKPRGLDSDVIGRYHNRRCLLSIYYALLIVFYIVTHLIFTSQAGR